VSAYVAFRTLCSSSQNQLASWFSPYSTREEIRASGDHAPSKSLQRSGTHKVLGRWRSSPVLINAVVIALVIALTTSVAAAAEAIWPKHSASDVSIFVTMLRFQIHADHCSAQLPQLKPKFDDLMENLNIRIQGISKGLLASGDFAGMKDTPVPAEILDALEDSFHDGKHNLERLDAASICPKTLQDFGQVDDESLTSGLRANLMAVQNMIQKLGK
jgi:hypothetical protein